MAVWFDSYLRTMKHSELLELLELLETTERNVQGDIHMVIIYPYGDIDMAQFIHMDIYIYIYMYVCMYVCIQNIW